jgi:beta-galactosidase
MAILDVTAGNPYYTMQDGLQMPQTEDAPQSWTTTGTWALYLSADRMFSSRQEPFLVTETNASSIGMPWTNQPAFDGQWRQAAWALISRGARMVEYWHWHTLHFGAETYWGGVLPHSGRAGRTYREIARIGAELRAAGDLVASLVPDADVTMLYSSPSKWALQSAPQLSNPDGGPDRRSYHGIFDPFYRGALEAGLQVRIVHVGQLVQVAARDAVEDHPNLIVPALYVADDATLDWLVAYAHAGGHLMIGPRTGYSDHEVRARSEVMPARMTEAAGIWYDEFSNLSEPLAVTAPVGSPLVLDADAKGTRWADGLNVEDAEVLATYEHPHFSRWATATTRAHGAGRVTYVGTVPNPALARALMSWVTASSDSAWRPTHPSVTVTSATSRDIRKVRFVHNWSWNPVAVTLPCGVQDVLAGGQRVQGDRLELGPWDVRVLVEGDTPD